MRKSTVFISSLLTTFALAILFGVVKAYQNNTAIKAVEVAAVQPSETINAPVPTDVPTQIPTPSVISPEQAASIAVTFLGDSAVYGVEVVDYEGVPAFLVTFSSGKLIYVSPAGEILAISEVKPVVVESPKVWVGGSGNGGGGDNGSGDGEHEDHHDDEHDDD
jgi:hypothetical protein